MQNIFDVLVIGGGHAGVEAANIASKLGAKTLLVTQSIKNIAMMPCNPSIGGPAKGVVVREITALGGIMGEVADLSFLQSKILNTKKGPGVWAIRNQIDKKKYYENIMKVLLQLSNLKIEEGLVINIERTNNNDYIVETKENKYQSKTVVLTTGTYSSSTILRGHEKTKSGPNNLKTTSSISDWLKNNNIELMRLKTRTPPRVDTSTIDLSLCKVEPGNNKVWTFGLEKQLSNINTPCYLTHTNKEVHEIILNNLDTSPLYSENYNIKGPARCPSIEDKVVRFQDKIRHQIFIEPDNSDFSISYLQGLSSSLDSNTQDLMLKAIPCFKKAKILKYAYAIEYDVIKPYQLYATLEFKKLPNFFSAGQINSSSGYEEAAGQGIIAGINAALKVQKKESLILSRHESYIGMLIDDLITKNITEPYRLLTSMMTYRMYVRSDNAIIRMNNIAKKYNLVSSEIKLYVSNYLEKLEKVKNILETTTKRTHPNLYSVLDDYKVKANNLNAMQIIKQPNVKLNNLINIIDELQEVKLSEQEKRMIEINIRYEGYIIREEKKVKQVATKDSLRIPYSIDFLKLQNISYAAKDALIKHKPQTIGQARRLHGVTISDIFSLEKYLFSK